MFRLPTGAEFVAWLTDPDRPRIVRAIPPRLASENAQAARECASQDRTTDPQPGAFYGLLPPHTDCTPHG